MMNSISFSLKKHKNTGLITLLLLLLSLNLHAQKKVILQNQFRSRKTKELNLTYTMDVTTTTGKFDYCQLAVASDTTLSVRSRKWEGQVYSDTTFVVPISQVTGLEYTGMGRRNLTFPALIAGMGGVAAVIGLPVAAMNGDTKSVAVGAIFLGSLEMVCLTIIFAGRKKIKYDLVDKWSLRIE